MAWPSKDYRDYLDGGSGMGSTPPYVSFANAVLYLGFSALWIARHEDAAILFVLWLISGLAWVAIGVRALVRRRKHPPS